METKIEGQFEARPAPLWSRFIRLTSFGANYGIGSTPAYRGVDIKGRTFSSAKQGNDVVALVFCGTWCKPCQWEVPTWNDLSRKYGQHGLTVIGVSMDAFSALPGYVASMYINYRMSVASSAMLWNFGIYPTGRIPVVAIINRHGVMSHRELGYHPKEHYEAIIKPLM